MVISADEISSVVQRFWSAYCAGNRHVLEEMYSPSAVVFGAFARRGESVQLTLARRLRKSGNHKSLMSVELGSIDVQIAGDIAIASYPYHFHLIKTNSDGSRLDLDVPYSRASQIFQLEQNGALRIIHEHFALSEPGKKTLISRDDPAAASTLPARVQAESRPAQGPASLSFKVSDTGMFSAANAISPDEVRAAVQHCWRAMSGRSREEFEASYLPGAIIFALDSRRSESARLLLARRSREFFSPGSSLKADLGSIDVQPAGTAAAIASYTFRMQMVRLLANGKYYEGELPGCRASAVFRRDEDGKIRILHEHQSSIEVGSSKEVPAREVVPAK